VVEEGIPGTSLAHLARMTSRVHNLSLFVHYLCLDLCDQDGCTARLEDLPPIFLRLSGTFFISST
jgi:hypothetical protein